MRVINDKGMLFGKINIIDFLVILFFICGIIMFYYGYKVINKKEPLLIPEDHIKRNELVKKQEKRYITINNVNFILTKLSPKTLKLISIGDEEKDQDGEVIGRILSLGKPEAVTYKINSGQDREIVIKDPVLQKVTATLMIKIEPRGSEIYYKDKRIWKDSSVDFNTGKYQVEMLYVSINEQGDIYQKAQETDFLEQRAGSLEKKRRGIF